MRIVRVISLTIFMSIIVFFYKYCFSQIGEVLDTLNSRANIWRLYDF